MWEELPKSSASDGLTGFSIVHFCERRRESVTS